MFVAEDAGMTDRKVAAIRCLIFKGQGFCVWLRPASPYLLAMTCTHVQKPLLSSGIHGLILRAVLENTDVWLEVLLDVGSELGQHS